MEHAHRASQGNFHYTVEPVWYDQPFRRGGLSREVGSHSRFQIKHCIFMILYMGCTQFFFWPFHRFLGRVDVLYHCTLFIHAKYLESTVFISLLSDLFYTASSSYFIFSVRRRRRRKKKKLYSTPNRQMYKLQYLTYQIYNLSNFVRTYIDIMCINIHRRYKKMININNVLWGRWLPLRQYCRYHGSHL